MENIDRISIVLLNMGGPDSLKSVRQFLFNLFIDPEIIDLPYIFRFPIATFISILRMKATRNNYSLIGGSSPLLIETQLQLRALETLLNLKIPNSKIKITSAMRYWHPKIEHVAKEVELFSPDQIIILPLYPQFSSSTTGSAINLWQKVYHGSGKLKIICCYPIEYNFIRSHVHCIKYACKHIESIKKVRLIFSAHGLPTRSIKKGDPYQQQIEATVNSIVSYLGDDWDWRISYQSKVGPFKWLGPDTRSEIEAAGREGLGVVIVPIAFVSEHIETLVELDRDYADFSKEVGCKMYIRVNTLSINDLFITSLSDMILRSIGSTDQIKPGSSFICSADKIKCPIQKGNK